MNRANRTARLFLVLSALAFTCGPTLGLAETPGEIPKPWTYEGSMKLQEQQRQQDQQFQQPATIASGKRHGWRLVAAELERGCCRRCCTREVAKAAAVACGPQSAARQVDASRFAPGANPNDPFGQLQALAKGGLCEVLFGGGVFEFRPDRLVGMDERTREQELDRVEYRGRCEARCRTAQDHA